MDKHYILKDPEDDVVLADVLIKEVLGDTVQFPTNIDIGKHCADAKQWVEWVTKLLNNEFKKESIDQAGADQDSEEEDDDDDEGDDPLEWWTNAHVFNVPKPEDVLVPLTDTMDDIVAGVLADVVQHQPEEVHRFAASSGDLQEKKFTKIKEEKEEVHDQYQKGIGATKRMKAHLRSSASACKLIDSV